MAGLPRFPALLTILLLAAGGATASAPAQKDSFAMNRAAESYVKLVLAVGQHDADYVDAYYGPPEWRAQAEAHKRPLSEIRAEAETLIAGLSAHTPGPQEGDELDRLRHA